ncbi:hypothetical protein [Streptomyces sp. NPDC018059]|uniref:hypothetical protein n=1 Tax=Streptomyces sp. NPDC018059 TaxID=3365041 RepID=UPI0037A2921D
MAGQELPGHRARMARLLGSDQQKKNLPVLERIRARLRRIAEEAGHPVPAAGDLLRAAGSADLVDRSEELRAARGTRLGRGAAGPEQALADITWARTPC